MLALGNLVPYYLLTVTLASMVPLLAWTVFVVVDCRTLQRVAEYCLHRVLVRVVQLIASAYSSSHFAACGFRLTAGCVCWHVAASVPRQ